MSDMVKYRAALWSFLKLTALVFYHTDMKIRPAWKKLENHYYDSGDFGLTFPNSLFIGNKFEHVNGVQNSYHVLGNAYKKRSISNQQSGQACLKLGNVLILKKTNKAVKLA